MAFKQPRVPEYRESEGTGKYLRSLVLFLKDFCMDVWTANNQRSGEIDRLKGSITEYYIQPRNLLDNSDFRNPVNQRGIHSAGNSRYIIDRWHFVNSNSTGNITITQSANGITITNDAGVSVAIVQKFIDKSYYDDKYTFVVKTTDSLKFGYTEIIDSENGIAKATIWLPSGTTVVWAALYEGSYTAETLPPYVSKGYASELAECQRYYRVFHVGGVGKGNYIGGVWPITPPLRIDRPTSKLIGVITTSNGETTIAAGGFDASMSRIRMDCLMTSSDFNWWQATYEVSADL